MPYCIYTDEEISEVEGNWDHIIPLSVGGLDTFSVWSSRTYNSQIGAKVDGAIANDFLVMFARRDADSRGHSNQSPIPIWKKSTIEGSPVQIKFGIEKIEAWDPKAGVHLPEDMVVGKTISSKHKIDRFSSLRFAAKVALGSGYFIYRDAFRTAVDCDELRRLITLDPQKARLDPKILASRIAVCDRFHEDAQGASPDGRMYRFFCEFQKRSVILAVPYEDAISFHVGVLGMYIASITCPAKTDGLPLEGDHDLGHAVILGPGTIERISFRNFAAIVYRLMTGTEPPQPSP